MTEPSVTLWAAARRDAILLTAVAIGLSTWAWSQDAVVMLGAALISALLYLATVAVVRHGRRIERQDAAYFGRGTLLVWIILPLLVAGATLILIAAASWDLFSQPWLTAATTILLAAWHMWFYFWMDEEK